jgi:hypothetical protein
VNRHEYPQANQSIRRNPQAPQARARPPQPRPGHRRGNDGRLEIVVGHARAYHVRGVGRAFGALAAGRA